jgi:hypothetical protein
VTVLLELLPLIAAIALGGVAGFSGMARELIRAVFAHPKKPTVVLTFSDGTCTSVEVNSKDDLTPDAIAQFAATVESRSVPSTVADGKDGRRGQ